MCAGSYWVINNRNLREKIYNKIMVFEFVYTRAGARR